MMDYKGKYKAFDFSKVSRYPIRTRKSKVNKTDLVDLAKILSSPLYFDSDNLRKVADYIVKARKSGLPIIWMSGAHLIKNGLSPILVDLMQKGFIQGVGLNGAATIHDFELALIGATSEDIPDALASGKFGFAEETGKFINEAIKYGNKLKLGYGESLGRMLSGEKFPYKVKFRYPEFSVVYNAYQLGIPVTVHVALGTDITHMHPEFDGEAVGGCTGRDFAIFADQITRLTRGGVCILTGSVVVGTEVYLKAFSLACNIGKKPGKIVTADFDLRDAFLEDASDESKSTYYFRDIKSLVTRIPQSFGGKGFYIRGNHKQTMPALYKLIMLKSNPKRSLRTK